MSIPPLTLSAVAAVTIRDAGFAAGGLAAGVACTLFAARRRRRRPAIMLFERVTPAAGLRQR